MWSVLATHSQLPWSWSSLSICGVDKKTRLQDQHSHLQRIFCLQQLNDFFFSFQKKDANCLVSALVILCYLLRLHTTVHSSNRHQKRKGKEKFLVIPVHHITSLYFCYFAQLKLCFMICIYIREYALLSKNTVILRKETTNLGHLCHLDYLNHCIKKSRSFLFSPLAQWILTSAQPNGFKRSSVAALYSQACTWSLALLLREAGIISGPVQRSGWVHFPHDGWVSKPLGWKKLTIPLPCAALPISIGQTYVWGK